MENKTITNLCSKCKKIFQSKIKFTGVSYKHCEECLEKQRLKCQAKLLEQRNKKAEEEKRTRDLRFENYKEAYIEKTICDMNDDKEGSESNGNILKCIWDSANKEEQVQYRLFMWGNINELYKYVLVHLNKKEVV